MTEVAFKTVESTSAGWERFQVLHACTHVGFMECDASSEVSIAQQYEGMMLIAQGGCLDCRLGPRKNQPDTALD